MKKSKILSVLMITGILTISTLGTNVNAASEKKSISVHEYLVANKTVVTYALSNRNDTLPLSAVEAEFGVKTSSENDPVKTGDEFEKDGKVHTIINYGDVNKDGKITTADALEVQKYVLGLVTLDDIQIEAADVERLGEDKVTTADALAIQQFVLGKRSNETETKTILNRNPVRDEDLIRDINVVKQPESDTNKYETGKEIIIAKVSSTNVTKLESYLLKNSAITSVISTEGTADEAKNSAHIIYEDDNNGEITIKLYAPYPGQYQISLNVQGSNVMQGGITKVLDPVTVEENNEITGIELYNGATKLETEELSLKTEKTLKLAIEFNHKYYDYKDNTKVIRTKVFNDVDGVSITKEGDNCLEDGTTSLANGDSMIQVSTAAQPATALYINTSNTAGTATITMNITSSKYTTANSVKLTINVSKVIADTIIINNTTPSTAGISIDLYQTYDSSVPKTMELNGKVYTILDVELKEKSEHVDLIFKDVGKTGKTGADGTKKLVVSENANAPSRVIDVIPLYKNGSSYEQATTEAHNVVAVGIAINTSATTSNLDQGLTIKYGEKTLPVTVNVK